MGYSYDVRIWTVKPRKNAAGKVTSYGVRWAVAGKPLYESYKVKAQAEGRRAELLSAQRRGEKFDASSGLPVSLARVATDATWFDFTRDYMDMKWPDLAATARQTVAESLIRVMPVFVPAGKGPAAKELRSALRQWGYNTELRSGAPADVQVVLDWCSRNTLPVRVAAEPEVLRGLQRVVTRRLDGKAYAPTVARKTRSVLWNALDYAVERGLIEVNPLSGVKWTSMPKGKRKIDRRAVPNPLQARTLLAAFRKVSLSGPRVVAYVGTMYDSALRPEEAAALSKRNVDIPPPRSVDGKLVHEWGSFHLDEATQHVGRRWTDGGKPRDHRQLKSRAAGEGRTVPCPPELTALLWEHIERYGFGSDGRLFRGELGGPLPMITYTRVWREARRLALTDEARATPLAGRPYDLRHAAVSTWLMAGVDPATVADWAGHSLAVLMDVYAACLFGRDIVARTRVQKALEGHV